ncbi:MAG TPA: ROK family transcriptional regulator [Dictyoglomaceae bacterium]|nr:ROK family transcriptional regulator [Dictyoglomaceae bacterium]HOL39062.1 ROK family transcriptional regulator [Dictyoglomaceae bacterium]HOP94401.1 ROK family transcriptional regulator [Dictyoglomaceae bacterium]HPP15762.1 ROK family transcriptional regulator [Dictyoglomaceae bacterium]HPU42751.1 ROK family transcriptional regulator [Dictyoglomaceae bacterium]
MQIGRPQLIDEVNKGQILQLLREEGPISRAEIARRLGLSRPTVSTHVKELINEGVVIEVGKGKSTKGRKGILLQYNAKHGYFLAGDIEGSLMRFAISDLCGDLLYEKVLFLKDLRGKNMMRPEHLATILMEFLAESNVPFEKIKVIAIGIAGIIEEGKLIFAPNLPEWNHASLFSILKNSFPEASIILENDVNMAVMGELWKGAGKGYKNIVYMNLSTGIGAGIVINEKLYEGSNKFAGEIAYMAIDNYIENYPGVEYTPLGALEWVASGAQIIQKAKAINEKYTMLEKIFDDYQKSDGIKTIIDRASECLGKAIVNIVSIVDPEVVIIGGIVGRFLDILIDKMQTTIKFYLPIPVKIIPSALYPKTVVYGAICRALNLYHAKPTIA